MEAKQIQVKTLALSVAAVLLVELGLFFSKATFSPWLRLGVARLLDLGLILWIVRLLETDAGAIGFHRAQWFAGLKKGLLWSAGFGILSGILFGILYLAGTSPLTFIRTALPKGSPDLLLFFLVGGIVAPVAEEVFFRGILYGFLRRWGLWAAMALSTCAFALPHGLGHGFPLTQVVGGILFAAAYEVEKNLLVPILIHCLGNMAIFTLSCAF